MDRKEIDRISDEMGENLLLFDGFDEAIVGVGTQHNVAIVVYSKGKIIEAIMQDGGTYEEAIEHFEFNVAGSYVGEQTPLILFEDWETQ